MEYQLFMRDFENSAESKSDSHSDCILLQFTRGHIREIAKEVMLKLRLCYRNILEMSKGSSMKLSSLNQRMLRNFRTTVYFLEKCSMLNELILTMVSKMFAPFLIS